MPGGWFSVCFEKQADSSAEKETNFSETTAQNKQPSIVQNNKKNPRLICLWRNAAHSADEKTAVFTAEIGLNIPDHKLRMAAPMFLTAAILDRDHKPQIPFRTSAPHPASENRLEDIVS